MRLHESPCLNCKDRAVGCHGTCERYLESVAKMKEAKEKQHVEKMLHDIEVERSLRVRENVRH